MSQQTIECLSSLTSEHAGPSDHSTVCDEQIARARANIRAGRYDDPAYIDEMLRVSMDRLLDDVRSS